MKRSKISRSHVKAFWEKVQMSPNCWEWTGYVSAGGYGQLKFRTSTVYAHRFSWFIHFGDIPKNMQVCHKCDNRKCIRPDHLFLGTLLDNVRDSAKKGRQAKNPFTYGTVSAIGVKEIRDKYTSGKYSQTDLATEYRMSRSAMSMLLNFKTYK